MSAVFFIGRYGLDFLDDFYPDDLPKEWRFDYYSNQFNALLLPLDTTEDIEGILEELEEDFHLVFEVSQQDLTDNKLTEVLAMSENRDNISFFMQTKSAPSKKTLALFKHYPLSLSSKAELMLTGYHSTKFPNCYLSWNRYPVLVSSLSLSEDENRHFFEKIAQLKQKTVIICRSAESANLEKARLISEMMGY